MYGRNPHPGHTIAIIDLVSRKLTGSIDFSPYQAPNGIQIDAAGMLYVTCDLSRKLAPRGLPSNRMRTATASVEGSMTINSGLPRRRTVSG